MAVSPPTVDQLKAIAATMGLSLSESDLTSFRELMKSITYPEGFFYVERATLIMFGLSSQLAPRLNTVQVGVPYIMRFLAERSAQRLAAH